MARMWRGPCAALKAAEADPSWARLHRRNAERGVFCDMDNSGRAASFYTISKQRGEILSARSRGSARAPILCSPCFRGSHRFTSARRRAYDLHSHIPWSAWPKRSHDDLHRRCDEARASCGSISVVSEHKPITLEDVSRRWPQPAIPIFSPSSSKMWLTCSGSLIPNVLWRTTRPARKPPKARPRIASPRRWFTTGERPEHLVGTIEIKWTASISRSLKR
jgi:hypothetical protein